MVQQGRVVDSLYMLLAEELLKEEEYLIASHETFKVSRAEVHRLEQRVTILRETVRQLEAIDTED